MVCPNQLSEMVIAQTKELIASLIGMKKKKESDEGDDDERDEGIEEDASSESDVKVEEILQGCANLSLRGEGWTFAQSEKSISSDEEDCEEEFRVLSSLNPVIINIESEIFSFFSDNKCTHVRTMYMKYTLCKYIYI